jgi:hypothetical protein
MIDREKIANLELSAESDSDWNGCVETSRSTQGSVIYFGGVHIEVRSILDKTVANSSNEAEIRAIGKCVNQVAYYRGLLKELGLRQANPTVISTDSQGAIQLTQRENTTDAQKHIRMKIHAIRDLVQRNKIALEYVNTLRNRADILTKALNVEGHFRLCKLVPGLDGVVVEEEGDTPQ